LPCFDGAHRTPGVGEPAGETVLSLIMNGASAWRTRAKGFWVRQDGKTWYAI
jgi:hypothetical protein